ncbi:hypothetical protein [Vibrio agarivorans]|uniref:hypothetical protein n=1 Tax=Vibrio agarivorans TaxID=153622 RepID=UPI0025B3E127|nr:hypothetical protein [Vibrio agarivorans]MDN3661156.1 hypothetical protein [Vibrio agarivorans]
MSPSEIRQSGSNQISHMIADALNSKQNPLHVMQEHGQFLQASPYFFREVYDQIDAEYEMFNRFKGIATQTMNQLDFGGFNGVTDFQPQNHIQESHMQNRIIRDMDSAIGNEVMGLTVSYLNQNRGVEIHNAADIQKVFDTEVTQALQQSIELQLSFPAKMVALTDLKNSVLQSFAHNEFLSRFGEAIIDNGFNPEVNQRGIFEEAIANGISVPEEFKTLQSALKHLESEGIEFGGTNAIRIPKDHRELSSVLNREGVDINNNQLIEHAREFKNEMVEVTERVNPFSTTEQPQEPEFKNLSELLNAPSSPSL